MGLLFINVSREKKIKIRGWDRVNWSCLNELHIYSVMFWGISYAKEQALHVKYTYL